MSNDLETFAEKALGPCTTVKDCSWPHRGPSVLRMQDSEGLVWYAKRHRYGTGYERELTAYRRWTPVLGDRAPKLRAQDERLLALLVSEVPGQVSIDSGPLREGGGSAREVAALHHQAGALLRRFHGAEEPAVSPDFAVGKLAELDWWVPRADGYLDRRDLAFVRSELHVLEGIAAPELVPCHLDYSPRNWLIDGDRIHVIDFEWAGREYWANDLGKLFFGLWPTRPALREAFLDGYGRPLTAEDLGVLTASYALTAAWHTIWAYTHDNPDHGARCRDILRGLMRREFGARHAAPG